MGTKVEDAQIWGHVAGENEIGTVDHDDNRFTIELLPKPCIETHIEMKSLFPCIFSTEFALCIPTVCIAGAITVARRGLKCSSPGENKHVLSTLP